MLDAAVDMHAHFLPPEYRTALTAAGIDALDGMPTGVPRWTTGSALELMDEAGTDMAVLSISSPDYPFTPASRVLELAALLRATDLLSAGERRDVLAGNARRLLPRSLSVA
jgi:predicted TIM-barrel fold metal-dependent hydrolase